jgi:hypothetical protein
VAVQRWLSGGRNASNCPGLLLLGVGGLDKRGFIEGRAEASASCSAVERYKGGTPPGWRRGAHGHASFLHPVRATWTNEKCRGEAVGEPQHKCFVLFLSAAVRQQDAAATGMAADTRRVPAMPAATSTLLWRGPADRLYQLFDQLVYCIQCGAQSNFVCQ